MERQVEKRMEDGEGKRDDDGAEMEDGEGNPEEAVVC